MSEPTHPSGADDLERTAERARELKADAADFAETARREAAHAGDEVDADYGFRLPDEIRHGDAVRARDDLRTAQRQQEMAQAQGDAAETLRRNAELLAQTREQIQDVRDDARERTADVRDVARDAETLRADTREIHRDVQQTPPTPRQDDGGQDDGGQRSDR